MIIPKSYVCPSCKSHLSNLKLEAGAAHCPKCHNVMFWYLDEGEHYNPDTFMKSLDSDKGKRAAHDAAGWFPGTPQRFRPVVAGILVGFIWQLVDKSFRETSDAS